MPGLVPGTNSAAGTATGPRDKPGDDEGEGAAVARFLPILAPIGGGTTTTATTTKRPFVPRGWVSVSPARSMPELAGSRTCWDCRGAFKGRHDDRGAGPSGDRGRIVRPMAPSSIAYRCVGRLFSFSSSQDLFRRSRAAHALDIVAAPARPVPMGMAGTVAGHDGGRQGRTVTAFGRPVSHTTGRRPSRIPTH
jgi:hypothetical protein